MDRRSLTSVRAEEANVIVEGVSVTVEEAAEPIENTLPGLAEGLTSGLRLTFLFSERLSAGV